MTVPEHKTTPNDHAISWYYPSTFNGKEKDSESGFHYYGARYYWSETLTGWLSVDPLADKYPGVSPNVSQIDVTVNTSQFIPIRR